MIARAAELSRIVIAMPKFTPTPTMQSIMTVNEASSPAAPAPRPGSSHWLQGRLKLDSVMKKVVYSKTAQKALLRMPGNWAIRISEKIAAYASDPAAQANNVKSLQCADGLSRLRVGDWRVIMWDHVVLEVLDIKSRCSAYKD